MSASRAGQKASALQAWARILLKPELGRVAEACQLLEQVALETIQMGGTYSQAQSKGCKNSCCCLLLDAKPAGSLMIQSLTCFPFITKLSNDGWGLQAACLMLSGVGVWGCPLLVFEHFRLSCCLLGWVWCGTVVGQLWLTLPCVLLGM